MPDIEEIVSNEPLDEVDQAEPESGDDAKEQKKEEIDDLAPELRQELKALWTRCTSEGIYADREEVKDVRQAQFYWRGMQYIWWSASQNQWNQLPTQGGGLGDDSDIDDMPRFQYVTNIYQAFGLSWIAVLQQAPPRLRAFPEDAEDGDDIETADGYSKLAKIIERWNPPTKLLQDEAYFSWTGGIVGGYVRYVADGERYGMEEVNKVEAQQTELSPSAVHCPKCGWSAPADNFVPPVPCPQCGTPLGEENVAQPETANVATDAGTENLPKGREVITIVGALNLKRPQWTQNQSEYHYLCYEREVHYAKARAAYPLIADQIQGGITGGADETYRRMARLSVAQGTSLLSQTGDNLANLVTVSSVWFRPSAFWMIDKKEHRDKLLEKFPKGCYVAFAGNEYAGARPESMDDHWVVFHALPGDGQHRPAVGSSCISIQDRFNTLTNIAMETYEYGIPITYRDSTTFDAEANEEQQAEPGAEVPVVLKAGEDIRTKIMTSRTDSISGDMYKHMNDLSGPVAQFVTGALPSSFGGTQENVDTASGQAMLRDQAMGRMGIVYSNIKQFHADVYTLACKDFSDNTDGKVSMSVLGDDGDFEANSVDISALNGDARFMPEGDENFPEMWNQKRNIFMQLADAPAFQPVLQLPENQELGRELIGIPELVLPGAAPAKKQLKEIKQLLKLVPVEIDPDFDDHQAEAETGKNWINGTDGQKAKEENPKGFLAVRQHILQHMQIMAQAAAAQAAASLPGQPGSVPPSGPPEKTMPGVQ